MQKASNLDVIHFFLCCFKSEKVWNVKDALEGLVSREAVGGYTCSKTNTEVSED